MVEEISEGVMFKVEAGVRYLVTEKTVRGGEAVKQRMAQMRAPLRLHLNRRLASGKSRSALDSIYSAL